MRGDTPESNRVVHLTGLFDVPVRCPAIRQAGSSDQAALGDDGGGGALAHADCAVDVLEAVAG